MLELSRFFLGISWSLPGEARGREVEYSNLYLEHARLLFVFLPAGTSGPTQPLLEMPTFFLLSGFCLALTYGADPGTPFPTMAQGVINFQNMNSWDACLRKDMPLTTHQDLYC